MDIHTPEQVRHLNICCTCKTFDPLSLTTRLSDQFGAGGFPDLADSHPHLFAHEAVFVSRHEWDQIKRLVSAIERIRTHESYVGLTGASLLASTDPRTRGVFNSYDFHLTAEGPRLIEINTNAGGAWLVASSAVSHRRCCPDMPETGGAAAFAAFEQRVMEMFRMEWALSGNKGSLKTVAIVDDNPPTQYLYPEFLLMRAMFMRFGMEAVIADPDDLRFSNGRLFHGEMQVDLVYNRLTDFLLEGESVSALRHAVAANAAVVTPHPWHHDTLANKRNLVTLTDKAVWDTCGLGGEAGALLPLIPQTVEVTERNAAFLWENRKKYYFKPCAGHAARGVYRGAKVTRSVWADIAAGGYIAQEAVVPGERLVAIGEEERFLKADLRAYTYGDEILLLAARLYQGQTTNMRTPGGGFAPVVVV